MPERWRHLAPISERGWAEIDNEARKEAAALGIKQFEMTSGLNDSPTFIAALADVVESALGVDVSRARENDRLVAAD